MGVRHAKQTIEIALSAWAGVETAPHRFDRFVFGLGRREIGHIHGDCLVDIPFPRRLRDEIVATGEAEPRHILPESGWVSVHLRQEKDGQRALRLLKRSYRLARVQCDWRCRQPKGEVHDDG